MSHGINANIVHGWRKLARQGTAVAATPAVEFVSVPIEPAPLPAKDDARSIQVELRRGALSMQIAWPLSASEEFSAWTRELLR
jgi:transposase